MKNFLPFEFFGNSDSKVLLIFIHGWPDTFRMWDNVTQEIKNEYEILSLSYPGYKSSQKGFLQQTEIAEKIKNTIEYKDKDH